MIFQIEDYLKGQAELSLVENDCMLCSRPVGEAGGEFTVHIRQWANIPLRDNLTVRAVWCSRHWYKLWVGTMPGMERVKEEAASG